MRRILFCIVISFFLTGTFWFEELFAPDAELWPRWKRHTPESVAKIDHSNWDFLLKTYVRSGQDGVNRFAYSRLSAADAQQLHKYVQNMASVLISKYNRREQFAYWINLYNALTTQVILTHYPISSIRKIDLGNAGWAGGPWAATLIAVEGEKLSLHDIAHRILRPVWRDPRIHYAITCGSIGCPNLRRDAYEGDTVNRVLESAARDFVNNHRGVYVEDGDLIVSSIYFWFQTDFGDSDEAVLEHLRRYAGPGLRSELEGLKTITNHRFNWSLNSIDLVLEG